MWIRFNNLKKKILKEDENFYLFDIWFNIIKIRIVYFFLYIFKYFSYWFYLLLIWKNGIVLNICIYVNVI